MGFETKCFLYLIITIFGVIYQCNGDEGAMMESYSKGDKVNLTCPFVGDVTWFKNDKEIKRDSKKFNFEENVLQFAVDKDLIGIFVCKQDEKSANLTVLVKPYVDQDMKKDKNTIQDEMLVIECKGFGYPKPHVAWVHKSLETSELPAKETVLFEDDRISFRSDEMENNTLRIRAVKYEDAGAYTCISNNEYGNSSFTISVKVKDKFAALWPFLAICAEVAILCTIIFIYEKRRAKRIEEEEKREEAANLTAANDVKTSDDVRQRK